jgi:diguanylate cyclase (GGDEF)-like protein
MLAKPHHTSDDAEASDAHAHLPLAYQKQSVLDAAQRMRNGLLLYPVIWLVLMQVDSYITRHPHFVWGHTAALILTSLARLVLHQGLPQALERHFAMAQWRFRAASLLHNAYWGCLCATVMVSPDAQDLRWMTLLSTVGITAGGTVIVALDAVLPLLYPLCTLGPTVLTVLPQGGATNMAISGLSAVLFAYSLGVSRMVSREYWARQRSQALLEQRAHELEALSRTDALTAIPNRLKFQEGLTHAWRDARRRNESMAIAMVDLDYFKLINDTHGHPFGDRCLQAAARALEGAMRRPYDLVARYGGEEFVVLMPNTDMNSAMAVAERMLAAVREVMIEHGEHLVQLSCSIGVSAQLPTPEAQPEWLVEQADEALYRAKQSGRARVSGHQALRTPNIELHTPLQPAFSDLV